MDDIELPQIEFGTLAAATNHFSLGNLLGEGGFGPVYKVIFLNSFVHPLLPELCTGY